MYCINVVMYCFSLTVALNQDLALVTVVGADHVTGVTVVPVPGHVLVLGLSHLMIPEEREAIVGLDLVKIQSQNGLALAVDL